MAVKFAIKEVSLGTGITIIRITAAFGRSSAAKKERTKSTSPQFF